MAISQKECTRLLQRPSSLDERAKEITPNFSPLILESKEHDTQEKPAAPEGEKATMLAELVESNKALDAMVTQLRNKVNRSPVRTPPLFPGATLECSEQLEPDLKRLQPIPL